MRMQQEAQRLFDEGIRQHMAGKIDEAVARYQGALSRQPDFGAAHNNLAIAFIAQGRVDDAASHFERALALQPNSAEAQNNLGNWLAAQGRAEKALTHYGKAIQFRPDYAEAHFNRAEIRKFRRSDPELASLKALASRNDLPPASVPYVHFALGKAWEDIGEYDRAFQHLRIGNDAKRQQLNYDEKSAGELFERTAAVFNRELMERMAGAGEPSATPIFILGMPRSGSTLVEQILASHPQVHAAGELPDLDQSIAEVLGSLGQPSQYPECVARLDAATVRRIGKTYVDRVAALGKGKIYVVDKLPGNFLNIGLIRLILPNAKIVHTMREALDTCVSCYSKLFTESQSFCYDLGELGRHYRRYEALMDHWKSVLPVNTILDVQYESVVDNFEAEARRLIDYCGLPWDDQCIEFHKASRPVTTASAAQARKPLFRSSLQRWRKYEPHLAELMQELENPQSYCGVRNRSTTKTA
jgi:tetratricopeptide (TPR) repeat protein